MAARTGDLPSANLQAGAGVSGSDQCCRAMAVLAARTYAYVATYHLAGMQCVSSLLDEAPRQVLMYLHDVIYSQLTKHMPAWIQQSTCNGEDQATAQHLHASSCVVSSSGYN